MKKISLLSKKYICLLCTKNWDMIRKKVIIVTKKKENRGKGIWMLLYR